MKTWSLTLRRRVIWGKSPLFATFAFANVVIRRLINHSCDPNCTAKIITINGEKKIVIYAKMDIELGDEITYGTPQPSKDCVAANISTRLSLPDRTGQNPLSMRFSQMSGLPQLDQLVTFTLSLSILALRTVSQSFIIVCTILSSFRPNTILLFTVGGISQIPGPDVTPLPHLISLGSPFVWG
jgi:hypothetical protein